MKDDPKKPLLNFSAETPASPEILAKFQRGILEEARRFDDELGEELRGILREARAEARLAEIHTNIAASKAALQTETLLDRIERLERGVRRLEKPRSGISGLFRRAT